MPDAPQAAEAAPGAAEETAVSSDKDSSQNGSTDWFRNAFARVRGVSRDEPATSQENTEESTEAKADAEGKEGSEKKDKAEEPSSETRPFKTFTSAEEFEAEVQRRAQSLKDKEIAAERKRQRDKEAAELLEKDPYGYRDKKKEWDEEERQTQQRNMQAEQFGQVIHQLSATFDQDVINPFFHQLPEAERQKVLSSAPDDPYKGRHYILEQSVKYVERQAEAKAREALRKDPVFRKELLADLREQEDEPEVVTAAPSSGRSRSMNEIMRQEWRARIGR